MYLNDMAEEIYATSRKSGFWPPKIKEGFPGWEGPEFGRNPFEILALIHSEVSEALEAMRDGKWALEVHWVAVDPCTGPAIEHRNGRVFVYDSDVAVTEEQLRAWGYVPKPGGVPSELADILIRVLDACGAWEIDIQKVFEMKVDFNRTRPYLHGRKR